MNVVWEREWLKSITKIRHRDIVTIIGELQMVIVITPEAWHNRSPHLIHGRSNKIIKIRF
jgi:hypothetical protein